MVLSTSLGKNGRIDLNLHFLKLLESRPRFFSRGLTIAVWEQHQRVIVYLFQRGQQDANTLIHCSSAASPPPSMLTKFFFFIRLDTVDAEIKVLLTKGGEKKGKHSFDPGLESQILFPEIQCCYKSDS